eukprot:6179307-Pleurochrysis_carterae.AAC.2
MIGMSVPTPLAILPLASPFAFLCGQARGGEGDRDLGVPAITSSYDHPREIRSLPRRSLNVLSASPSRHEPQPVPSPSQLQLQTSLYLPSKYAQKRSCDQSSELRPFQTVKSASRAQSAANLGIHAAVRRAVARQRRRAPVTPTVATINVDKGTRNKPQKIPCNWSYLQAVKSSGKPLPPTAASNMTVLRPAHDCSVALTACKRCQWRARKNSCINHAGFSA